MVQLTQLCIATLATSSVAAAWWPFEGLQIFKIPSLPPSYNEPPRYTRATTVKPSSTQTTLVPTKKSSTSVKVPTLTSTSSHVVSLVSSKSTATVETHSRSEPAGTQSSAATICSAKSSRTSTKAVGTASGVGSSAVRVSSAAGSSAGVSSRVLSSSATLSIDTTSSTSSYSVTSVAGCPPITVTTELSRIIPTVYTETSTRFDPQYVYTSITGTFVSTKTIYGTNVTVYTQTSTYTSIVVSSATTTVTIPTSPGFTPVLCEPTYYAKTTTVTNGNYYTIGYTAVTDFNLPVSTLTAYTVSYNVTVTASVSTGTITTIYTSTVTETRSDLTKTAYDACATNNIASLLPNGYAPFFISNFQNGTNGVVNTESITVTALDPVDCCELCQANSTCTSSSFRVASFEPLPRGAPNCRLFLKQIDKDVCDPDFIGSLAGVGSIGGPYAYFSNSGCGQYDLVP